MQREASIKQTVEDNISVLAGPSAFMYRERIWKRDQKKAALKTYKEAQLNSPNPGRVIIKTPVKPKIMTSHLFNSTRSLSNNHPSKDTINGATKLSVTAVVIGRFFKPQKNNIVAAKYEAPLKYCIL